MITACPLASPGPALLPDASWFMLALTLFLLFLVIILLVQLNRLSHRIKERDDQQQLLRFSIDQLSLQYQQQTEQLQQSLHNKVSESGRELRDINALFLSQLQQSGQGNSQMLDNIRQSVQEQMGKIAANLREMQLVATDVRSLRQALGSVRGRGIIGELHLERLLADVLAPGQYRTQMRLRSGNQEAVDAAILISSDQSGQEVVLPVDAKFPLDYLHRLLSAREADDEEAAAVFSRELTGRLRQEAKKISELYILPPRTADFAIMYLPGETLFAEAMRDGALAAEMYRQYHVLLAGPTSMAAILAGLRAVFRLQSMERRSLLIAGALSSLQHELQRYEDSLRKVHGRLTRSAAETEACLRHATKVRRQLEGLDLAEGEEKQQDAADPSDEADEGARRPDADNQRKEEAYD